jgi:PAS domain S-box-containing protein
LAEAIVDTVREPLLLLSPQLRVLKVNRAFCRTFQLKPEQSVGLLLSELGGGQWNIEGLRAVLEGVLSRDEPFEDFEVAHDFPGMGPRVMMLNARLLRQEALRAPLILLAIEDVTERRTIEESLQRQTKELERSNRDLEEFAYVASHDLQEPLRMVVSYCQLLASRYKGKLDLDADDFIGYAVDGAKRMQRLISDLLAYSRLNRSTAASGTADCGEALADALGVLSFALEESAAKVEAAALPRVRADYGQLVQLFQNLVGNAVKFRSKRPLLIGISSTRDGGFWSFRIEDNGIGIDPQYYEKVFIIFERLHGADVPGNGIGLALCRKIVQSNGGRIWIEPGREGMGTALCFTLPDPGETKT